MVAALAGLLLVLASLQDAFEVVLLPRRVRRHLRITSLFFQATWSLWSRRGARLQIGARREAFLSVYGPLSIVLLFTLWALCLISGFGLLQWGLQGILAPGDEVTLASRMMMSGDAFFTLGYGDVVPRTAIARLLVIAEAGTGFGFIAVTISYLPVLYQHFSQRDAQLIQLAVRAGSPATAATLLVRFARDSDVTGLNAWLRDWELWAADIMESHSSYPMLAFYRSQHSHHSWLASLAVLLDCCTLMIAWLDGVPLLQAAATFSAAHRVVIEMSSSLGAMPPGGSRSDRFPTPTEFERLRAALAGLEVRMIADEGCEQTAALLRAAYEPHLEALSAYLLLPLPSCMDGTEPADGGDLRDAVVARLIRSEDRPCE